MNQAIGTTMTLAQAQNAARVEGQPLPHIDDDTVNNTPAASGQPLGVPVIGVRS